MPDNDIEIDPKVIAVINKKGYQILERLSEGAFRQVFKAANEVTGGFVAVKVIDLKKVGEKLKQKFLPRELAALIEVRHENVIQVYGIFKIDSKIYIWMEFAGNGDIGRYVKKHGALEEPLTCVWFTQMAYVLNYLHNDLHIAHRHIAIDSFLLNDHNICKLTDFRFAKEVYDVNRQKVILSRAECGNDPYYCPQIVKREQYNPFLADVWAMGVVLFEMLNNKLPFDFGDKKRMLREQTDPNHLIFRYNKKFSSNVRNLIERMCDPNEDSRITFADVLKHEWVKTKGESN